MLVFTYKWRQYIGVHLQMETVCWCSPTNGDSMLVFTYKWRQYVGVHLQMETVCWCTPTNGDRMLVYTYKWRQYVGVHLQIPMPFYPEETSSLPREPQISTEESVSPNDTSSNEPQR
jgi:hypothetical protein